MIGYKTFEDIVSNIVANLESSTGLTDFTPGSITRALADTFGGEISAVYRIIDINLKQGFPSTSKGRYLDLIASIVGVFRRENESDENLLYRMSHRWEEAASSNEAAVRLAALSVPGVKDVYMKPYVLGSGSFVLYPVPEAGVLLSSLISPVRTAVSEEAAYGTRFIVEEGDELIVDLTIELLFNPSVSSGRKSSLIDEAHNEIGLYLENLSIQEPIVLSQITHHIMSISESKEIQDVAISKINLDGESMLIDNLSPSWNERYVPGIILIKSI